MANPPPHDPTASPAPGASRSSDQGGTGGAAQESDRGWFKRLGPGLITGAADDDPSGIATYSQAGAQFGFGLLWTVLLTWPLMAAIQIVSAHIGRVSGHGLGAGIRAHYPRWLLYGTVSLLAVANTINIGADIAAMGDAAKLIAGGGPAELYAAGFGIVSLLLQVFIPYSRYVRILKWLTLALFAYVGTAFAVDIPWAEVGAGTLLPRLSWQSDYITTMVAVFGTTISPYLFFWQAAQEVEEMHGARARPLKLSPADAPANFRRIRFDTWVGMGVSNLVAWFIMVTTALTLHRHGITDVQTSADAAKALRPVAGELAFLLFGAGIIGTGLLAVPVLAGSAAYAMADAFRWRAGLELRPGRARRFYGIIAVATLLGVALCFSPIDPIRALYWSAVVNGVISVPIMVVTMHMAKSPRIMGPFVASWRLRLFGWLCTATMAAAVAAMFWNMAAGDG